MVNQALALRRVVTLMRITGMGLIDACRIVGSEYEVDSDWLYRQLTE